jgi:hypothetical protein
MNLNSIYELEEIKVRTPLDNPFSIDKEKIVFHVANLEPFAIIQTEVGFSIVCPQYPQRISSYPYAMCGQEGEDSIIKNTSSLVFDFKSLKKVSKEFKVWIGAWDYEAAVFKNETKYQFKSLDCAIRPYSSDKGWVHKGVEEVEGVYQGAVLFLLDVKEHEFKLISLDKALFELKVLDSKHILHSAGIIFD